MVRNGIFNICMYEWKMTNSDYKQSSVILYLIHITNGSTSLFITEFRFKYIKFLIPHKLYKRDSMEKSRGTWWKSSSSENKNTYIVRNQSIESINLFSIRYTSSWTNVRLVNLWNLTLHKILPKYEADRLPSQNWEIAIAEKRTLDRIARGTVATRSWERGDVRRGSGAGWNENYEKR